MECHGPDAAPAREINKRLLEGGICTTVRWNFLFVVLPPGIEENELREGLTMIDKVVDMPIGWQNEKSGQLKHKDFSVLAES